MEHSSAAPAPKPAAHAPFERFPNHKSAKRYTCGGNHPAFVQVDFGGRQNSSVAAVFQDRECRAGSVAKLTVAGPSCDRTSHAGLQGIYGPGTERQASPCTEPGVGVPKRAECCTRIVGSPLMRAGYYSRSGARHIGLQPAHVVEHLRCRILPEHHRKQRDQAQADGVRQGHPYHRAIGQAQ